MARKRPINDMQVVPIYEEKSIVPLVEQLNGLIDRYNVIYGIYEKIMFTDNELQKKRLHGVLLNIERAIQELCLQIAEPQFLIKTNQSVP